LTITVEPEILLSQPAQAGEKPKLIQRVVLLLADREISAQLPTLPDPPPASMDKLIFTIDDAPLVEGALLHLRIDDVESLPFKLDPTKKQPAFDDSQRVTIR
jgi:hypothetical protein